MTAEETHVVTESDVIHDPGMNLFLRGPRAASGKNGGSKLKSFKIPLSLDQQLIQAGQALGRDQADLIVGALNLDLDLGRLLGAQQDRLNAYAATQGLNLEANRGEVLARLVLKGLDAAEHGKKAKK